MNDEYPGFAGELENWPSNSTLAEIFRSEGYLVTEGKYSVSLDDFSHFVFRELGSELGSGTITAESDSTEDLIAFSHRVSRTLANAGIKHRFEIYSEADDLIAYIDHDWPKDW
jgi:hypothetical protein